MAQGAQTLTEKEKEALRLLLAGHDAKSSARELDVSVHTLNDRLRAARRKLGVTTSKEAARMLGAAEEETNGQSTPKPLVHKGLGVREPAQIQDKSDVADDIEAGVFPLTPRRKGLLIMSLVIAASLATLAIVASEQPQFAQAALMADASSPSEEQARAWLSLIDSGKFDESYDEAARALRDEYGRKIWELGMAMRKTKGTLESRELLRSLQADVYPGRGAGEFQIVEFNTQFPYGNRQIERVVLEKTAQGWKVSDYDITEAGSDQ